MFSVKIQTADVAVLTTTAPAVVVVWRHGVDGSVLPSVTSLAKKLKAKGHQKPCLVTLTLEAVRMPSAQALADISAFLESCRGTISASAVVHFDTGWRAKLVATVTYALEQASSDRGFRHRPFLSLARACAWLAREGGVDGGELAEDLRAALAEL